MVEEILGLLAVEGKGRIVDDLVAHFMRALEVVIARELPRLDLGQALPHIGPSIAALAEHLVGKLIRLEDSHFVLRRVAALQARSNRFEAGGGFVLGEDGARGAVELDLEILGHAA